MTRREFIKGLIKGKFKQVNYSFSQEGEDMILDSLLKFKKEGFYVDIGAYHPYCFSNTMRFYDRGWHGINIDAMPGSKQLFNKLRKRDINIEAGISVNNGDMTYYLFQEGALNTFDKDRVKYLEQCGYTPIKEVKIKTYTIMQLLDKYLNEKQKIDFMDIDIEGFDERVIAQIDFNKYKPTIIMTENWDEGVSANEVLKHNGYEIRAFTSRTAIYMQKEI